MGSFVLICFLLVLLVSYVFIVDSVLYLFLCAALWYLMVVLKCFINTAGMAYSNVTPSKSEKSLHYDYLAPSSGSESNYTKT